MGFLKRFKHRNDSASLKRDGSEAYIASNVTKQQSSMKNTHDERSLQHKKPSSVEENSFEMVEERPESKSNESIEERSELQHYEIVTEKSWLKNSETFEEDSEPATLKPTTAPKSSTPEPSSTPTTSDDGKNKSSSEGTEIGFFEFFNQTIEFVQTEFNESMEQATLDLNEFSKWSGANFVAEELNESVEQVRLDWNELTRAKTEPSTHATKSVTESRDGGSQS